MNKRQKKKLENRAGFFHYKDYKWRVKLLYNMFSHKVANGQAPCLFKQLMFEYAKNILFTRPPKDAIRFHDIIRSCRPINIPSMSARMVGDKIHSFSIDKDSFKNGYKPDELAVPLPRGPLDGFKSMATVGRYGNMSIKGVDKDISGPIHLGPIDLGPTDGGLLEEHLDDLIDRHKRFAGYSCEAMGMEVD